MLVSSHTDRIARMAARLRYTHMLWVCSLAALSMSACKLDEKPPAGGGLVVAIDTDMSMPKDVDEVSLEVTQGTTMLFQHDQKLDDSSAKLPLEFQVPDAKDNAPVLIRAVARKDGEVRIERSAITTVPTSYLGYVRLILNYLCDGLVSPTGESSCGPAQTCIQGTCQSAAIATSLPDFFSRDGSNTGSMQNAATACFDVAKCFSMATEMTPDPSDGCSFKSSKLFPTDINVALRLDPGSAGVCTQTACWVVLDSDGDGFRVGNDERVVLPAAICAQRGQGANLRVAMSMQCPSKKQGMPLCRDSASVPGDPQKPVTVGMSAPPVSDACAGGGARACEMCGSQGRMCQSGLWSEFGMCADQGVCVPEMVESCGVNGVRTCGGDCTWGDCENQTCDGPATRSCGSCGTQHRSCNNGAWSEWSACGEEGVCSAGDTQACGSGGVQACMGNCAWGDCSMQVCEGAVSEACGNCGTRTRTCDSNTATWSEWGACAEEGECRPDSTMVCGRDGEQTCGGNCRWDVGCNGQTCEGPARRACGLCGTQTRTCDMMTGEYSDWSACFGEGECMPDALTACGTGGERSCGGNCRWGSACTGQTCTGPSSERCGDCGTRTRTCNTNTGAWTEWSACSNEGDCTAGETRTCGAGGTQTCSNTCRWSAGCPGQMCDGSPNRQCPNNPCGIQTRTCNMNTGMWNPGWGACSIPQAGCTPGETAQRQCGASGEQTCTNECTWPTACTCSGGLSACQGTCVDQQTDEANCGRCGMRCLAGQTCEGGECTCPANQQLCNGQCQSVQTNGQHCGKCGVVCESGTTCMDGMCRCPGGQVACGGMCVNTNTDNAHCGACASPCNGQRMCMAGMCRCPANQTDCGAAGCVDTATDEAHCGSCTAPACTGTNMCMGGTCQAECTVPGQVACGSDCVDHQTNNQHCGDCKTACMNGMTCQAGECECPPGTEQCGGPGTACVQLNTNMNCSDCGDRCDPPQMCNANTRACECGGATPNLCGTACTNTQSDPTNCGDCGVSCGGRACTNGTCACAPTEHLCGERCVVRSAQSCGTTCQACERIDNGVAVGCSEADRCQYECTDQRPLCGGDCCGENQMCSNGACQTRQQTGGTGGGMNQGGAGGRMNQGGAGGLPPLD